MPQTEEKIFDPIRKEWVSASPEELVRQELLRHMVERLGFPDSLIAVEKSLKEIPHLLATHSELPDRRVDILAFAKDIHPQYPLFPLLVIECKSVKITEKVLRQVCGYHHYIHSSYLAVANAEEVRTGWFDTKAGVYRFVPNLPSFSQLLSLLK